MDEDRIDLAPDQFKQLSFEQITKTSLKYKPIGGFAQSPGGLKYYSGNAYIWIQTSPHLRIVVNDGSDDRVLIGEL